MKKITMAIIIAAMTITMCVPVFATQPAKAAPAQTTTATTTVKLTADQAKAIALSNAGFTEKEVRFVKNQLEFDDGIMQYDIEFVQGTTEYEYDIDANTGAILSVDIDLVHVVF
jgi:uncharacterized membrane protein YkoI